MSIWQKIVFYASLAYVVITLGGFFYGRHLIAQDIAKAKREAAILEAKIQRQARDEYVASVIESDRQRRLAINQAIANAQAQQIAQQGCVNGYRWGEDGGRGGYGYIPCN